MLPVCMEASVKITNRQTPAVSLAGRLLAMLAIYLDLGDPRRDRRVIAMAESALIAAGSSIPQMFGRGGDAGIKGASALLSNEHVTLASMRSALYSVTWAQIKELGLSRIIVAFDPTYLAFNGQTTKKLRWDKNDGFLGYVWLNCVALHPDTGAMLGVLHQALMSADGPDDVDLVDYGLGVIRDPEARRELSFATRQQFLAHALHVARSAPSNLELHFVADREFDDGLVLRELTASCRCHFTIRSNEQRAVMHSPQPWLPRGRKRPSAANELPSRETRELESSYLADVVSHLPLSPFRKVPLDSRGRICVSGRNPAHIADLHVGAMPIVLAKRSGRAAAFGFPEQPVALNLVVVREANPRGKRKPLEWRLLTDLPISSLEEIARVVDAYEFRWRIEEFFRTTKDVLELETSRLDDPSSTARLLFFTTLRAMFLEQVRVDAGMIPGIPPTDAQRRAIVEAAKEAKQIDHSPAAKRRAAARSLSREKRALCVLGLLAEYGFWENRRGASLGPYVLLRGLLRLTIEIANGHYRWLVGDPGW